MIELASARAVLQNAIGARVFPGAVVEVGHAGGMITTIAEGHLTYDAGAAPVDVGTVYDLASLTKVLATTTLTLDLVRRGLLALDDRVSAWIPEWNRNDRMAVTIRHLLDHSSGLPAHRRYFEHLQGQAAYEQAICAEPLEHPPGSRAVYSDAGFMLLGFVLERAGGSPLDRQFDDWRDRELGSSAVVRYRPPDEWKPHTAPTEADPWRGRTLVGDVHDENAAALEGVAAHAGLFGTASGVGEAARWWLRALTAGNSTPDSLGSLARTFVAPSAVPGSSRALGWDTMRPTSSCGSRMSAAAFGHTGFTGTSLWIDPADRAGLAAGRAAALYVVLLTNRVHPSRDGDRMTGVRQALHDAVIEDLGRT